jgi:outer membrane protein TolC
MKKINILVLVLCMNIYGEDLSELLSILDQSKKVQSLKQNLDAQMVQNQLFSSYDAPNLNMSASHTKEQADDGLEYSLGMSQTLYQPFSSDKQRGVEFLNGSLQEQSLYELKQLSFDLISSYHSACISKEISQSAQEIYNEQDARFAKLELSFAYGEISRKDLLFNKLDLAKLKQSVSVYKRDYLSQLSFLQELIGDVDLLSLSCDDLYEIKKDITIKESSNHSIIKQLSYEEKASESFYELYDSNIQSLEYSLSYDKELSAKRYTFGVSIPLSFLGSQNELQKKEYLYQKSSIANQKAHIELVIDSQIKTIKNKLDTLFHEYTLLNEEILPISYELKQLTKAALDEGEISVMEYLDATRSYTQNILEMLEMKREYYNELFEFSKKADLDLGEIR